MPGKNILICCRASGNGDGSKANQHVAPLAGHRSTAARRLAKNAPVEHFYGCCRRSLGFDRHFSTDSYFFLIAYNFIKLVKKNLQI